MIERVGHVCLVLCLAVVGMFVYDRFMRPGYFDVAQDRERLVDYSAATELKVAVVWPCTDADNVFFQGAQLAVDEIERAGGVQFVDARGSRYTRHLRLHEFCEWGEIQSARLARQIAHDTEYLAAIGHHASPLPAAITYDAAGVLYIASNAVPQNGPQPSQRGAWTRFSLAPGDDDITRAMVLLVPQIAPTKVLRVALLYPQDVWSKSPDEFARLLLHKAKSLVAEYTRRDGTSTGVVEIEVTLSRPFVRGRLSREVIHSLLDSRDRFNMILIADALPDAAILRQKIASGLAESRATDEMPPPIISLDQLDWAHSDELYLRLTPSHADNYFDMLARLLFKESEQRAAAVAPRTETGRQFLARIATAVSSATPSPLHPLRLVLEKSYDPRAPDFAALALEVWKARPDYLFFSGGEESRQLIEHLRLAGFDKPIICGLQFDLLSAAHQESNPSERRFTDFGETYVAMTFDAESTDPQVQAFLTKYKTRHSVPDYVDPRAAYGYMSVYLVKRAFELAGSPSPSSAVESLRILRERNVVLQLHPFAGEGNLLQSGIVFTCIDQSRRPYIIRESNRTSAIHELSSTMRGG